MLGFSAVTPVVPLVGQGLAYSVFAAALWPSIPFVVADKYVGTAYGLLTAIQNGGMSLFPVLVGQILAKCNSDPPTNPSQILSDSTYDDCQGSIDNYKYTESFFVGLAVVGFLIGLVLNYHDSNNGWLLNSKYRKGSEAHRAALAEEEQPLVN